MRASIMDSVFTSLLKMAILVALVLGTGNCGTASTPHVARAPSLHQAKIDAATARANATAARTPANHDEQIAAREEAAAAKDPAKQPTAQSARSKADTSAASAVVLEAKAATKRLAAIDAQLTDNDSKDAGVQAPPDAKALQKSATHLRERGSKQIGAGWFLETLGATSMVVGTSLMVGGAVGNEGQNPSGTNQDLVAGGAAALAGGAAVLGLGYWLAAGGRAANERALILELRAFQRVREACRGAVTGDASIPLLAECKAFGLAH